MGKVKFTLLTTGIIAFLSLSILFLNILLDQEFIFPNIFSCLKVKNDAGLDQSYCQMIYDGIIEISVSYGLSVIIVETSLWLIYMALNILQRTFLKRRNVER
jgi:hypothetical protein